MLFSSEIDILTVQNVPFVVFDTKIRHFAYCVDKIDILTAPIASFVSAARKYERKPNKNAI